MKASKMQRAFTEELTRLMRGTVADAESDVREMLREAFMEAFDMTPSEARKASDAWMPLWAKIRLEHQASSASHDDRK